VTKKSWIIFAVACLAVIVALVAASNSNKIDVSDVKTGSVIAASEQSGGIADRVYGKADSKVVFIEYGDYQCPGCQAAHEPIKNVVEQYKDKIAFVFRNFPLNQIHPNALAASAAAEAAGLQGKFWEMHDKLYEDQSAWKSLSPDDRLARFSAYAQELGLNIDTFKADLGATSVSEKIKFDQALGKKIDVDATPSFFFGDKKAENITNPDTNAIDEDKLKAALDALLKQNGITPPAVQ
jgi:protein-disulfide isomerase